MGREIGISRLQDIGRFHIEECIGQGGMGAVYRAFDRERGMDVALKTLLNVGPAEVYLFKNEFRALADCSHPNLVSLYELGRENDIWYLTMELLDGIDFLSHVRGGDARPASGESPTESTFDELRRLRERVRSTPSTQPTRPTRPPRSAPDRADRRRAPVANELRLRDGLAQLALGVNALHDSGYLHRDIKPSNVLVTREGRVVLLDFGVVAEVAQARHFGHEVAGTPDYMAPEQAVGQAQRASDWYAVGVMLYEALTGGRPKEAPTDSVVRDALDAGFRAPRLVHGDCPQDLSRLCVDLLARDPERRPSGSEVLARLETGANRDAPVPAVTMPIAPPAVELVGRDRHMDELRSAYDAVKSGSNATVFVRGSSGMGKTALVQRFLDEVASDPEAVLLTGRCYEREQLPHKALDSIVDALCHYLMALPSDRVEALAPQNVGSLCRVFPVLSRVEAFASAAASAAADSVDPHRARERGFRALRELLGRLAERRPLVLFIDDAQWGDADSAPLLDELMRPPAAPPLLLLLSYRSEDEQRSALLRALLERSARGGRRIVDVGPLEPGEARLLAAQLLEDRVDATDAIVREANGHPFFLIELARFSSSTDLWSTTRELSLDTVIAGRMAALSAPAQRLLHAVALAGRPIPHGIATQAARLGANERPRSIQELRVANLVRSLGAGEDGVIECYHDRIRESATARLDPSSAREHHLQLARAYQASQQAQADTLAIHLLAAGETEEAYGYVVEAARQAESSLSFDRAARLYELALELRSEGAGDEPGLRLDLAIALQNAGRGGDAARAFLDAAGAADDDTALELQRLAVEQYLRSGYLDEGLDVLRDVLKRARVRYPKTRFTGLVGLLLRRAQLRLRGLRFRTRSPDQLSAADLFPVDVCWSAGTGLAFIDSHRAAGFATRGVIHALRAGDPTRLSRMLLMESCLRATEGTKNERRARQLFEPGRDLAVQSGDPQLTALATGVDGFIAFQQGSYAEARDKCGTALKVLDAGPGVPWALGAITLVELAACMFLGDVDACRRIAAEHLAAAQRRGDLFTKTNVRTLISPMICLVDDDPEGALGETRDAIAEWGTDHGFHTQHWHAVFMASMADLYAQRPHRAYVAWCEAKRPMRRALMMFVQLLRCVYGEALATSALASAAAGTLDKRYARRLARRRARILDRESALWATGLAHLVRACEAAVGERPDDVVSQLRLAIEALDGSGMSMHAAACRHALGKQLGGDEGRAFLELSDHWARQGNVRRPAKFYATIVPAIFEP